MGKQKSISNFFSGGGFPSNLTLLEIKELVKENKPTKSSQKLENFDDWFSSKIVSGRNCMTVPKKFICLPCGCLNFLSDIRWINGIGFVHSKKDGGCDKVIKPEREFLSLISTEKIEKREEKKKQKIKRFEEKRKSGYFSDCFHRSDRFY